MEREKLKNKNIWGFNAGQFLFRYSKEMVKHFNNVIGFMDFIGKIYFYDQKCVNQYFNNLLLVKYDILEKYVLLFAETQKPKPGNCIYHFFGCPYDGRKKLEMMSTFFKKSLNL